MLELLRSGYSAPVHLAPQRVVLASFAVAAALSQPAVAQAADITVLCSNGMRAVMEDLVPQFEKSTTHRVTIRYGLSAALKRQI